MEQLVIRLGSHADHTIHWLVWSGQANEVIACGELAGVNELTSLHQRISHGALAQPAVVLVPASDVLLKEVTLPPRANRKVIAAIPFMLEDDVAGDISLQFFAYGQRRADIQPVAVVAQHKMQQWLQWLSDANLTASKMVPDVLALPSSADPAPDKYDMTLLALGDDMLLRQADWQGLQGEKDWLMQALAYFCKQQPEPLTLRCLSEVDSTILDSAQLNNINLVHDHQELPFNTLAQGALSSSFNLLQGQYKPTNNRTSQLRPWRTAAALAASVLLVLLVDKGITLQQLNQQNERLNQQLQTTITQQFPNLGRYRDARSRIERELQSLQQGGGNASMLAMLDKLNNAFAQSKVTPQTLRFDATRNELRMQAQANNFEALATFKRIAESNGFSVEQGAINNREQNVVGTIAVRSSTS